jgi:septum formation protein
VHSVSLAEQIPPQPDPTLVLASGSPRRRTLLAMAGFTFDVSAPDVDESRLAGETPEAMVVRLATAKAEAVAARRAGDACVLACDTTVVLDGTTLGKPTSIDDATAMLLRLAGLTHEVITGYAIRPPWRSDVERGTVTSRVTMRQVNPMEAADYAASGEPLDKAGGYALQGDGGRFVAGVDGSRSNVIGLPLETIVPLLERFGLIGRRG